MRVATAALGAAAGNATKETTQTVPQAAGYRDEGMFGSVETVGAAGVFGQVMGLVAVTLCFFTLGAYLGAKSPRAPRSSASSAASCASSA